MVGAYAVSIQTDGQNNMSVTLLLLTGLAFSLGANYLVFMLLMRYLSRQLKRHQQQAV